MYFEPFNDKALTVIVSEMLVASADSSDVLLDDTVERVLHMLRERLGMDAVFVSEFVAGRRHVRFVDRNDIAPPMAVGDSVELEATFCKRVVEGRLPEVIADVRPLLRDILPEEAAAQTRMGSHLSTPVMMNDGSVFGTLCCFSTEPNPAIREQDLTTLRHCARLVARKLELTGSNGFAPPAAGR